VTTKRLMMDVKVGESIQLGDGITITLEQKSGQLAKLCIQHNGVDVRRLPDRRSVARQGSPGRRLTDGQ
jgi:hypothetical protein